jgi:hypothetical protein
LKDYGNKKSKKTYCVKLNDVDNVSPIGFTPTSLVSATLQENAAPASGASRIRLKTQNIPAKTARFLFTARSV